ncbi:MAG TPA: polyprenol monophosphomannose synthase [Polyangiaceae bacterium]|nr:polyprenol monophosphomannose synthase [Polyangiaceae bacterium]
MDRDAPPSLVVVVPTFEESRTLEALTEGILERVSGAEILVVDDASSDGTSELADRLARDNSRVHVMHRSEKLGLGTAYVDGFGWALDRGFDRFAQMDADLSHDPRDLVRLVAALDDGADLAIGSRGVPGGGVVGWGLGRHLLSKGGSLYARTLLGSRVRDLTSGFKAMTRRCLLAFDLPTLRSNGYAFQIETTHRAEAAGLRVVELPIVFTDRRVGASKMSRRIFIEAITAVPRMRLGARTRKSAPDRAAEIADRSRPA